jgi:predicted transcriptional regulator
MPRKPSKTFTDKEVEIMRVLWEAGEATVKQVQERLPGPPHYNNVLTIIRVLERKGHVAHREEGRAFIYRPKARPEKAHKRIVKQLLKDVFGGSAASLVLSLVETGDLTREDLDAIRQRLAEVEQKLMK